MQTVSIDEVPNQLKKKEMMYHYGGSMVYATQNGGWEENDPLVDIVTESKELKQVRINMVPFCSHIANISMGKDEVGRTQMVLPTC